LIPFLVLQIENHHFATVSFLGYETVRGYVKSIYQKLHVASATEAVAKALKEKLV